MGSSMNRERNCWDNNCRGHQFWCFFVASQPPSRSLGGYELAKKLSASPTLRTMEEFILYLAFLVTALAGLGVVAISAGGKIRAWIDRFESSLKHEHGEHLGHKRN